MPVVTYVSYAFGIAEGLFPLDIIHNTERLENKLRKVKVFFSVVRALKFQGKEFDSEVLVIMMST